MNFADAVGILAPSSRLITSPGFYDLTAAEYHADPVCEPSLSSSLAVDLIVRSPAHARLRHPRLCDASERADHEETDAMAFGTVVHSLLLGKGSKFSVWHGETWRGGEAQAFKASAEASGVTAIKCADFDRANAVANAARVQLADMGLGYLLTDGKSEQVAVWREGESWCRAMFDKWIPERDLIVDIKTTGKSAHPEKVAKLIAGMDYDMRSQFYLRGAAKLTGIPARKGGIGFMFLFVETAKPYCVTPCFLDEAFQARGTRRAAEAIDIWARCMESKTWPGYAEQAVEIAAPGWVDFEIEETEIAAS